MAEKKQFSVQIYGNYKTGSNRGDLLNLGSTAIGGDGKLFTSREAALEYAKAKAATGALERDYDNVSYHVMQSTAVVRQKAQPIQVTELSCEE